MASFVMNEQCQTIFKSQYLTLLSPSLQPSLSSPSLPPSPSPPSSPLSSLPPPLQEVDRNLLRECILCPASTGLYPRIESLLSMKQGGSPTLADQVIYLGSVPHKSDGHERDSGHTHHQPSSCTLDLGDNYLVNYVELQGYPTASHLDRCRLCFLYTLKVSRDKVHWHKLFDYSVFKCCGNQHLCFPQQVVR